MTDRRHRTGVLLMAHGTPNSLDEMPEYLTRVRGGRPPSAELLEEITANYRAIGGRSPLTDITTAQGRALQAVLGDDYHVVVGMRNWHPFIDCAVDALVQEGVRRVIGIPLAPQFSTLSVQKYLDVARAALPADVTFSSVRSFHAHPLLLAAFAERIRQAGYSRESGREVVFTAHSLPSRAIAAGDPYAQEVATTAAGVAALIGLTGYEQAYQSAGRTPEPWLGPDLSALVRSRAAQGVRAFLIVPVSFVCDHSEILFDIDVQAVQTARDCGVSLRRTESLNQSPLFISLLADLVASSVRDA